MRPWVVMVFAAAACGGEPPPPEWPDPETGGEEQEPSGGGGLTQKLIALWPAEGPESVPKSASAAFDAELMRSKVYVPAGGDIPTTVIAGSTSYVVYTDEGSFSRATPSEASKAVPAVDVLAKARDNGYGVTVVHDGDVQVFVNLDATEVKGLLGTNE